MRARALIVAVLLTACNRAPTTGIGDRQIINAAEIAKVQAISAYDIVAKLRPEFLKPRGPVSGTSRRAVETPPVDVFIDGVESGPADAALPRLPAAEVVQIRHYRAADATTKYGTRHGGGVIEVTTVRTARP